MSKENLNQVYGVPNGYDYVTAITFDAWEKVTVTCAIAKCQKTGKQITKRFLPTVTDWEEAKSGKWSKKRVGTA